MDCLRLNHAIFKFEIISFIFLFPGKEWQKEQTKRVTRLNEASEHEDHVATAIITPAFQSRILQVSLHLLL